MRVKGKLIPNNEYMLNKMKKLIIVLIFVVLTVGCTPKCPAGCECVYHEDYIEVTCINGYSYNITYGEEKVRVFR